MKLTDKAPSTHDLLLDPEDEHLRHLYYISTGGYAVCIREVNGMKVTIYLHKQLMNSIDGVVDHINGNTLDNRKENLRVCTHQQNCMNQKTSKNNTSGYKGVTWKKANKLWCAQIVVNYHKMYLGLYTTAEAAALAYNEAAKRYHGKYAKLNKVD